MILSLAACGNSGSGAGQPSAGGNPADKTANNVMTVLLLLMRIMQTIVIMEGKAQWERMNYFPIRN